MDDLEKIISSLGEETASAIQKAELRNKIIELTKAKKFPNESEASIWLAEQLHIPYFSSFALDKTFLDTVPRNLFLKNIILPIISDTPDKLTLVSVWPISEKIKKQIFIFTGKYPEVGLSNPENVAAEVSATFVFDDSVDEVEIVQEEEDIEEIDENDEAEVVIFVNNVIKRALRTRVTDIHFEPQRHSLQIRYRIDGDLVMVRVPPNLVKYQDAIISRIKIMSSLNISEKRRPQDGKISFKDGSQVIDIRVSTLPVIYGESISMRLLRQGGAPTALDKLDMTPRQLAISKKALGKPHGIILVTGPTGSGKSTTLTSFLKHVQNTTIRLMTVEDPVEYEIAGTNQTQVNAEIGLTFASVLRSLLRQDPDVIMLGEIRDGETADIAVRAAVTGHLVLSTIHTNDAVGSVTRLKDVGIAGYMIASAVEMVLAQRLVRRLCPHCAKESETLNSPKEIDRLCELFKYDKSLLPEKVTLKEPVGCEYCNGIGYHGRMAVFEVLGMNEEMHEAIVAGATESEMRQIAIKDGMTFLAQDAFMRACRGLTAVDEAMQLIP